MKRFIRRLRLVSSVQPSFTEDTAKKVGKSQKTIQRSIQISKNIPTEIKEEIKELPAINKVTEIFFLASHRI